MIRNLFIGSALAALVCGCAEVPGLPRGGCFNCSVSVSGAPARMRLCDRDEELDNAQPSRRVSVALAAAASAEASGDRGSETLCLEQAYRASFQQPGVQRWDQERQRADIAHRLEGLKRSEGRGGAAVTYAVMAALSEAYLDSAQSRQDRAAWEQAQAVLAQEQARAAAAQEQADDNFLDDVIGTGLGTALGAQSLSSAVLQDTQSVISYAQQSAAIGAAEQGIALREGELAASTEHAAEDQAVRLMAAYLEVATDQELYAREIKRAVSESLRGRFGPAVRAFLACDLDGTTAGRRDFVAAFAKAQRELWLADAREAPLEFTALSLDDFQDDAWRTPPEGLTLGHFLVEGLALDSGTRVLPGTAFTAGTGQGSAPKELTGTVATAPALALVYEQEPYPGPGLAWNLSLYGNDSAVAFQAPGYPDGLHGQERDLGLRWGLDWHFLDSTRCVAIPYLGLSTLLFQFGDTSINPVWPSWYEAGSLDFMSLDLGVEAGLRLFHFLDLAVESRPLAPLLSTDSHDSAVPWVARVGIACGFPASFGDDEAPSGQ